MKHRFDEKRPNSAGCIWCGHNPDHLGAAGECPVGPSLPIQEEELTVKKKTLAVRIWAIAEALLGVLGVPLHVKPGIYRHYKGDLYVPVLSGRWSSNGDNEGDIVVVYFSLEKKQVCLRFEAQFSEKGISGVSPEGDITFSTARLLYLRFKLIEAL